ncbi:MAG: ATP-binding cassette domain-containing protein [Bowdeniella nasicola]|nr:ATP-binding cassette domain-containing protein [Bowdeniella nasicola]
MPQLSVRDLSFCYHRGGEELFGGLSHTFTPGAVTALTGPSGRGKSTLLYVLGLLLTPSSGAVELDAVTVSSLPDRQRSRVRAQEIGFIFQDSELNPSRTILDSVIEPTLYGQPPDTGAEGAHTAVEERALHLLERFGLAHRAHHRPGEISGGQAQRVAVCRALMNAPSVLLADEPTGNLDRDNAALVLDALAAAAGEGKTVIIATHDPFVLTYSSQQVEL